MLPVSLNLAMKIVFTGLEYAAALGFKPDTVYAQAAHLLAGADPDAEPEPPGPNWPSPDWPETTEQYLERLRTTPTHLCRLRYFGPGDRWSFGFYTYSNERYELSIFPSGDFFGTAEEALRVAAGVYLSGG